MADQDNQYEFREIENQTNICLPNGKLNPEAAGWSRKPIFLSNLRGNIFRKKLWNYWCITGAEGMFSVTISDIDYAGMIFVYYLDYATGKFEEDGEIVPLSRGIHLPDHPRGSVLFENDRVRVEFKTMENSSETRLLVDWKNFHGKKLKAEFIVSNPIEMESLNVVVPWTDRLFQYTSKQNCLPATGYFFLEKDGLSLKKIFEEGSFACLDYGRGVWPYKASWNWGCFSGMVDQTCLGLNIGGKWTDGTGISENGILINGKLTKIQEPIHWSYNRKNFKDEWTMKTLQSDILDVTFTPFFERKAITNLIIIYSEVHQCFGRYSGTIRVKNEKIQFENVVGWAEEHIARW